MNPAAMGLLLFVALSLFTFSVARRFLPLFVMQPDNRLDNRRERVVGVLKLFFGQLRFLRPFERVHGIAHVMIFWGAVVVTLSTIQMAGRGFSADFHLPGFGGTRLGLTYVFLKDLFTLSIMAGCTMAFVNRVVFRPARMILSVEALVILNWIFWMIRWQPSSAPHFQSWNPSVEKRRSIWFRFRPRKQKQDFSKCGPAGALGRIPPKRRWLSQAEEG